MGLATIVDRAVTEARVRNAMGPASSAPRVNDETERERNCYNSLNEATPMPESSAIERITGGFDKKLAARRQAIRSQCDAPRGPDIKP